MDVAGRKFSPQTIKILELRRCGMKQAEIADSIGCSLDSVRNACKYMPTEQKRLTEEEARAVIDKAGYDYVEGFVNAHSKVIIKCRKCGGTFEKMYKHLHSKANGTYKNIMTCPHCSRITSENRRAELEYKKQYEAWIKAEERASVEAFLISRQLEERLANRICKNCGKEYCIESSGYNSRNYCSEKCMKRWAMRVKNDRRLKKINSRNHDNDITLEKLFRKDNGICYLCAKECDWNDMDPDGNACNNYPSIDHVIPIAKGGTHTWDNVRLAHRGCNTAKRDLIYTPVR